MSRGKKKGGESLSLSLSNRLPARGKIGEPTPIVGREGKKSLKEGFTPWSLAAMPGAHGKHKEEVQKLLKHVSRSAKKG